MIGEENIHRPTNRSAEDHKLITQLVNAVQVTGEQLDHFQSALAEQMVKNLLGIGEGMSIDQADALIEELRRAGYLPVKLCLIQDQYIVYRIREDSRAVVYLA